MLSAYDVANALPTAHGLGLLATVIEIAMSNQNSNMLCDKANHQRLVCANHHVGPKW